jgi:hypothetical protein
MYIYIYVFIYMYIYIYIYIVDSDLAGDSEAGDSVAYLSGCCPPNPLEVCHRVSSL